MQLSLRARPFALHGYLKGHHEVLSIFEMRIFLPNFHDFQNELGQHTLNCFVQDFFSIGIDMFQLFIIIISNLDFFSSRSSFY
jgi:hypothetical protein